MKKLFVIIMFQLFCMTSIYAQFTKEIDTESGLTALVGKVSLSDLEDLDGFENLLINPELNITDAKLETIKKNLNQVRIVTYIGTWCEDSQVYFPELISLLRLTDYDVQSIDIYSVNRTKKLKLENGEELVVDKVPTIVLLKDGKELGRIVEYPKKSIGDDIFNILNKPL